jgi:hypothetical protein
MSIEYVRKKVDPTLKDVLDLFRNQIFLEFNCHAIATVKSFNAEKQTITATINYPKTYFQKDAQGNYQPLPVPYPVLVDLPVVVVGGGDAFLTMPIVEGDQAVVLFNDRDFDNWYQGGKNAELATNRMHSMADGIAIIGLHSLANPIPNYDTTRATLRNGETGVGVSTDKVKIFNSSDSLGPILVQLVTDLATFATAVSAAATVGDVATAATTLSSNLTAHQTILKLQGLLE